MNAIIYDFEVFIEDWIGVFKNVDTGEFIVVHNDNDALREVFSDENLYIGFNSKHYDAFIVKAIVADLSPREVKKVNDYIIVDRNNGWDCPLIQESRFFFNNVDLMDDCQMGLSLKAIEAHLGMDIRETTVDFDIDRPLTEEELQEVIFYCKHDVDATEKLYFLRKNYLDNKVFLGRAKGIPDSKAMYMTNAKLTAAYLDAHREVKYTDEREYVYPSNLLRQYIPNDVFVFFDRLHDKAISDYEVFSSKLNFNIGDCQCTIGYGGIHGAIPTYRERSGNDENET